MKLPFEQIKRELLVKKESLVYPDHGKNPEERTIVELLNSSVICLNKPEGPTSHQTADYVKKVLKVKKAGHGGSLDPKVTGVLPIGIGKSTRIMQTLLKAGKEYVCLMHIHKPVEEARIRETVKEFTGRITQMPPIKSAVKRQLRKRDVYYFEILEIDHQDVLFRMGCQAGTYVRKICFDFGKALGTNAHMHQLVRTKAGPFTYKEWRSLTDIKDAYSLYLEGDDKELKKILKPSEHALSHLAKVYVFDSTVNNLCHGSQLYASGISKIESGINVNDMVAVLTLKNELICLGYAAMASEEMLKAEKGLAVKNSKVFMEPDAYPKNIA